RLVRVDPDEVLTIRLPHRHGDECFFDADALREAEVDAQPLGVEWVGRDLFARWLVVRQARWCVFRHGVLLSDGVRRDARRAPCHVVAGFRSTLPRNAIDDGGTGVVATDPGKPRKTHSRIRLPAGPLIPVHHWKAFAKHMHTRKPASFEDVAATLRLEERK